MAETNAREQKNEEKIIEQQPKQSSESEGKTQQKGSIQGLLEINEAEKHVKELHLTSSSSTNSVSDDEEGQKEKGKKKKKESLKNKMKEKIFGHHEKKGGEEHTE